VLPSLSCGHWQDLKLSGRISTVFQLTGVPYLKFEDYARLSVFLSTLSRLRESTRGFSRLRFARISGCMLNFGFRPLTKI
jgi:hypothetical protein